MDKRNPAIRMAAVVGGGAVLGGAVVLGLAMDRPDPQEVVQAKILTSAEALTVNASTALKGDQDAEAARSEVADKRPLEVLESRVTGSGTVEWDVVMAGGASGKYLAAGRLQKFHACFRLSGKAGQDGVVSRTDIDCPAPTGESAPDLGGSVLLHLPDA